MEIKNKKVNENLTRVGKFLESSVYPSLIRVLDEADRANAISYNRKFRQIFMNRLAEDLWYNNPLHPERERTSVCNMPFTVVSDSGDGLRPSETFSWGMTRDQAAIIIQVYVYITIFKLISCLTVDL